MSIFQFYIETAKRLLAKKSIRLPHNKQFALHINHRGQGLIEYLIIIAFMGVGTLLVVRTLNQTVNSKFTNVIYSLQGKQKKARSKSISEKHYKIKDFSNFNDGTAAEK